MLDMQQGPAGAGAELGQISMLGQSAVSSGMMAKSGSQLYVAKAVGNLVSQLCGATRSCR